jgi:predicted RNA binding protein YcfA (HicA-like mRNA interferase family)
MSRHARLLARLLGGDSDAGLDFDDLRMLLGRLGFEERTRGSHHIFRRPGLPKLLTLQRDGRHPKVYQVRQVRALIREYGLHLRVGEED